MRILCASLILLAAVASPATAAPRTADKIFRKSSRRAITATVISEDCLVVKYRPGGVTQTLEMPAHQVDRIEYEDTPEAYTQGLDHLQKGDLEDATNSFKLALKSKTRNNWIQVHGNYQLAQAYAQLGVKNKGNYRQAADVLEKLTKDHPNNRYLADGLMLWGQCLAAAGSTDDAAKVFDQLATEAKAKNLGLAWEARAKLAKAEGYATAGNSGKAAQAFDEAGRFAKTNAAQQKDEEVAALLESIAGRAELSQGEALLHDKKYREARSFFEKIVNNRSATPESVAGAMCGIGEVHLAEDRAEEALLEFARVRVKFFLMREQTARATFYLGRCCLALGDKEPGGKRKARDYFTEVVERYDDTAWANKARAELN